MDRTTRTTAKKQHTKWQNTRSKEDIPRGTKRLQKTISRTKEEHIIGRIEESIQPDPRHRASNASKIKKVNFKTEATQEETKKYLIRKYFAKGDPKLDTEAQKVIGMEKMSTTKNRAQASAMRKLK